MVQTAKELQYCVNNMLLRRDKDEMVARDGQDLRVPTLSLQTSHPSQIPRIEDAIQIPLRPL
jgi:hypothetical protein